MIKKSLSVLCKSFMVEFVEQIVSDLQNQLQTSTDFLSHHQSEVNLHFLLMVPKLISDTNL